MQIIKVLGILGTKAVDHIDGNDIVAVAKVLDHNISPEEGLGILTLVRARAKDLTELASSYVMSAAKSGELNFLLPGRSANREDFGEFDFTTRCPKCHNPELLDIRTLPASNSTECPFCACVHAIDDTKPMKEIAS